VATYGMLSTIALRTAEAHSNSPAAKASRPSVASAAASAVVLCIDEKSQIQALDRTAPILPLRPGLPEKATHDYRRNGTTTAWRPACNGPRARPLRRRCPVR
jgi:hypothetical protein